MLNQSLVIARKEIVDSLRDVRALFSSLVYALMGPVVVGLISLSIHADAVLIGMMSVFTLVSAFVGGMNVAMDTVAGERERRSLLPLLLNPVPRRDILMGKWLAISAFSITGVGINLLGFGVVLRTAAVWPRLLWACAGLIPLALLAAALQLLVSTVCRGVKEAQTYLSMLVFLPMGLGMFLVFFPQAAHGWGVFLPVAGQHLQLEALVRGGSLAGTQALALASFTASCAWLVLILAAGRFERDEIIYGD